MQERTGSVTNKFVASQNTGSVRSLAAGDTPCIQAYPTAIIVCITQYKLKP